MDVIFDIDGTLADCSERLPFALNKNWDQFFNPDLMIQDTPIEQMVAVCEGMLTDPDFNVLFVTGRPMRTANVTFRWLRQNIAIPTKRIELRMREVGDRRPSAQTKQDLLTRIRKEGYDPKLAFDDRASDAAMYRSNGVMCAQVAEGQY